MILAELQTLLVYCIGTSVLLGITFSILVAFFGRSK